MSKRKACVSMNIKKIRISTKKKKAIRITNSGQLKQQWCHNFEKKKLKLSLIPMLPSF